MLNRQNSAPLFQALCRHAAQRPASFHTPGHSFRGLPEEILALGGELFQLDLSELPGLDDLHNPRGPIAEAQGLAAGLYGADHTFFLINGTTVGLQGLLTALAGGREVIVPRNAHRSVLAGLIISGADPVYILPEIIPEFGLDCGASPLRLQSLLASHPGTAAVLAVSPSYYGVAGDLAGQALAAHEADKPLLVDEAHGAHLRFHRELPRDAMAAGADASVQSTHKLGGSLTQTSLLHLRGRRVDAVKVAAALSLLQTTSPSYILLTSLDLARRQLALKGEELLDRTVELAQMVRLRLSQVRGLRVLGPEHLPAGPVKLDLTKLVISVQELGLTGYQAGELLAGRYNVFVEMADASHVVAFVSIGTTPQECDALVGALTDIAVRHRMPGTVKLPEMPSGSKKILKPRDAWFSPSRKTSLQEARGRISAETIAVYPPGIPAVYPGEEFTDQVIGYLAAVSRMGLPCHGPADPSLKTVQVVIE